MKEAVAGELAAAYDSAVVDEVRANDYQFAVRPADAASRPRIRLLLRRRSGCRLRLPGAAAIPGPERLPDRRNHPQPACQRAPPRQRHPVSLGFRASSATTLGPDDVVILPAFGVTVGEMAQLARTGLHARGYHLRVGAERLEERDALRAGRLHLHHPRQGEARRDPGDRIAGAEISARAATSSCSIATRRRSSATTSGTAAIGGRFLARFGGGRLARLRSRRRSGARRLRQSDDDADDRVAGDR